MNQFKVPFRLAPTQSEVEGKILLLRGDQNSNTDTGEWYAMHGFVTRFLNKPVFAEGQISSSGLLRAGKKTTLEVHEIDVS